MQAMHSGELTDEEMAEAVVYGLATPRWRRVISRGERIDRTFECALQCGHVVVVPAKRLFEMGGNWLVCEQCTFNN